MEQSDTKKYIQEHIKNVQYWIYHFAQILIERGSNHDKSKLQEPEYSLWCKMDQEPRYKYGSKEYKLKKKKWARVFKIHFSQNRHHPEYFWEQELKYQNIDLVDLIEMMSDWLGYRKNIRALDAIELVTIQCQRYGFSDEIRNLILNTLINYYVENQEKVPEFKDVRVIDILA